jgi:hypothetical protein
MSFSYVDKLLVGYTLPVHFISLAVSGFQIRASARTANSSPN